VKKSPILDFNWITKGTTLDPEYFTYILLDASQKYRKELESGKIDKFYEVIFHSLNLNTLSVEGKMFKFNLEPIFDEPRIDQIKSQLKELFSIPEETVEILRNANYVFSNLILDYMDAQLDILEEVRLFYMNKRIHLEKEIFIVTNIENSLEYTVWKLSTDKRKDFQVSFKKIKTLIISDIKENALKAAIDSENDPKLKSVDSNKNVCFGIIKGENSEAQVADIIKNIVLLNKGIAKKHMFQPNIMEELHTLIWHDKVMPFTLNNWI
jgi:hypothetical protein